MSLITEVINCIRDPFEHKAGLDAGVVEHCPCWGSNLAPLLMTDNVTD
jgi:hypothetical protein